MYCICCNRTKIKIGSKAGCHLGIERLKCQNSELIDELRAKLNYKNQSQDLYSEINLSRMTVIYIN